MENSPGKMHYDFEARQFMDAGTASGKCAIAGTDGDINWQELADAVHKLSDRLLTVCHSPEDIVLIYGHKEKYYPVAILACIHSGITYVPLDKIYPESRLQSVLNQTKACAVINCTTEQVPGVFSHIASIGPDHPTEPTAAVRHDPAGDPVQYIMFTSGTTGEPKGVMIRRSSALLFIRWALRDFGFMASDVFMNQAPFTFDVSLCDLFCSLALGSTLVLNSASQMKEQDAFIERIRKYGCSVWTSTPSFVYLFLRHPSFNAEHLPRMRSMLFIGEELPTRTCAGLFSSFPEMHLANAYGPTEATIVTTHIFITEAMIRSSPNVPIGRAMPGAQLLIQKTGEDPAEGELLICGNHVSAGYLGKPELSGEKFPVLSGSRCYITGDMVRKEDDIYYFLGRNDNQVKLNGYRIELDEISTVLANHPRVIDAVAVPLKQGNNVRKIIAFIIPEDVNDAAGLQAELREKLQHKLPYYMIPSDLVFICKFPYNTSHKLDKKLLIERFINGEFN
ncbi:MAG: AMP-binding protein [Bacteroidia bacterium]|nr:AMP-binding protein [Bacteroidia bacterium]